jgi:TatD DNase family protein
MLIDSHAHLTDDVFTDDVAEVIARTRAAGVTRVVTIGTHVDNSRAAAELAATHDDVYASAGIHPHYADTATPDTLSEIAELAARPRVVAIGETGLDYHYDNAPRERQRESFRRHLAMGRALDLPVVVHARDADDDLRAILREDGAGTRGVLHCFASGRDLLMEGLEIGWYVSFSGMITFKRFEDADFVREVPIDRLLIETDSPYLAPVPHRGKRNEPAYVALVAKRAAEIRGEDPDELSVATARNAIDLFRLA